ncbi:PaaI family thioesterase [Halopiger xanaduensis]|uniref:Phenylacetic acid degradation-related protein n=1 Tax=Halopiger xanaduensis (strain DSM 18323 / JCM 14033 / SH-6) TaxID=797210 RepID=F8D540_HALXS|nr:PaaI family thioesterase [Halopiger xanaduensis]AEH36392.1 phenylacetic acid degradation-related protein [Halopiger xanaduensis SH-6]
MTDADEFSAAMDEFGEHGDLEGFVQYFIDEHQEFLSWIGTSVDNVGPGTMTLSVPYDEKLTNTRPHAPDGRRADIHGGIAATLLDTAGGLALRTEIENPFAASIATINLNVNYLRPATGDLTATANVVRAGSSVGVSEIVVESTSPDGETCEVAIGQGAYRIFRDA